jgi:hypothetical protein
MAAIRIADLSVIFGAFLRALPGDPVRPKRTAAPLVSDLSALAHESTSATFAVFVDSVERGWAESALPRLKQLREHATDGEPALARGDELQLFRPQHETDYSNWLAWLFSDGGESATVLQPTLLRALAPDESPAPLTITRERWVAEGFEDHAGSIDLILRTPGDALVLVVENKTRAPSADELRKHPGYARSVRRDYPRSRLRFVLLVPDELEVPRIVPADEFKAVSWRRLTLELRQTLAKEILPVRIAVFVGLFVAAVERFVLRYPVSIWRDWLLADSPQAAPSATALRVLSASGYIDYLEESYARL